MMHLFDAVEAAILTMDMNSAVLSVNTYARRLLRQKQSDLIGQAFCDLTGDRASCADIKELFASVDVLSFPVSKQITLATADQDILPVDARFQITMRDDTPLIVCTLIPTDSQLFDENLYRLMFERNLSMKMLVHPETGQILRANEAAATFYGYSVDEFEKLTIFDINPTDPTIIRKDIQAVVNGKQSVFETENVLATGETRTIQVMSVPLELYGERYMYSVFIDLSEQRRLQAALEYSEALYNRLLSMVQQAVVFEDRNWRIARVNDMFCRMLGYTEDELVGMDMFQLVDESQHKFLEQEITSRSNGEPSQYDLTFRHKRGFPRYTIVAATPIFDANGAFDGSFAVITDVTENKIVEDALRKSNAELDAFSHTVAHDLKDPLATIITYSEIISENPDLNDDISNYLEAVNYNANKMVNIIDELMLLSQVRRSQIQITALDCARIVHEALNRLSYVINQRDAQISFNASLLPSAMGYAPWVEAVWVNYISNAIKYGGTPPRITIGADVEDDMVRYWVRDDGVGIDEDAQGRLFLPFERLTDDHVRGHGIGLSIVRRIIEKLGGQVGVNSTTGQGSEFYFTLPAAKSD